MTTRDELVPLAFQVTLSDGGDGQTVNVDDVSKIDAGARVLFFGSVPAELFVYALLIDDSKKLRVLSSTRAAAKPGSQVRIPEDGGWITIPGTGDVRVIGCAHTVADDDWPELPPGRDGRRKVGSTKESISTGEGSSDDASVADRAAE